MKLALIDRILELEDNRIVAVKSPTLSEDYMHDHFPSFPVMPGVLMLESMYQAGAWLVRQADGFSHSMVLMREARNVKYSGLVRPGEQLRIEATLLGDDQRESKIKAICKVDDRIVASGRLVLERFNLAGGGFIKGRSMQGKSAERHESPAHANIDRDICRQLRKEFQLLMPAEAIGSQES